MSSVRVIAQRTQHFVDRFTDLLDKKRDVEFKQVFFANKFVKEIQSGLTVPINMDNFVERSCAMVEQKLPLFTPS